MGEQRNRAAPRIHRQLNECAIDTTKKINVDLEASNVDA